MRLVALSRAPFGSNAAVSFPLGGDAAGGEESPGRLPIFRVRVGFYWIRIEYELHSFFSFVFPLLLIQKTLDLHPRLANC